jgi:hypothetical protein
MVHQYKVEVKAKSARWWAVKHVYPGAWKVDVVTESGETIGSASFVVKPILHP